MSLTPVQYEPLTPVDAERQLSQAKTAIARAQLDLRTARIEAAKAMDELERARVKAAYAPECPKVVRGEVTVADRDMWITRATVAESQRYRHAETLLEIAKDASRSRIAESVVTSSLSKSVGQSYAMAGTS